MTVKDLKEMLKDAPDDMGVYVDSGSALGGFLFKNACVAESGIVDFGEPDEKEGEIGHATKGFIIMAHGSTVSEEELENGEAEENTSSLN